MQVRTGDALRRCHWHPSVPPSWGHFPTQGDTHAASQVLPGLGEEGQGLLALLSQLVDCGVCQHGDGEVQLGFHQEESVGHLRAGAGWLRTLMESHPGGWVEGVPLPWHHPYRQLVGCPLPIEEPGAAFGVLRRDVLL